MNSVLLQTADRLISLSTEVARLATLRRITASLITFVAPIRAKANCCIPCYVISCRDNCANCPPTASGYTSYECHDLCYGSGSFCECFLVSSCVQQCGG